MKNLATYLIILISLPLLSCAQENIDYPKAIVSYSDFKTLVNEVENHRAQRLVNLDSFLKMSKQQNVVILDTRSTRMYNKKHLKGAIHLDFTDFTQTALNKLIPDPNTTILIYCNNNFDGDQINFATKKTEPLKVLKETETGKLANKKPFLLALNIPTYINLYGYGFKNIYELNELVNINDFRLEFEGSDVIQ